MVRRYTLVNWRMLVRVLGWLLMIEGAFMVFPLITAALYSEPLLPYVVSILVTIGTGVLTSTLIRPHRYDMGKREGFLLTSLVWVVFSFFGLIPFLLCHSHLTFSQAFFESMSGFTTTGATTMTQTSEIGYGLHLWRSLMQWIGGMGIILFTLAVLPMLNSSGGMQMFNAEVTGITHEKLRPRVSATAKRLWLIYTLLTIALVVLNVIGPMNLFDSICHAMSTMSTGGFSTTEQSINSWNSLYVKIVTVIFMFIGGVNFSLIFRVSTGQLRAVWHNEIFRFYVWTIVVLFVVFDISLYFNDDVPNTVENLTIEPLFQIVSMISSTGYTSAGFNNWGPFLLGLTMLIMFSGACAGSTSGGAKLDRILMFWKNSRNELTRCVYPNHILSVENNGRTISPEIINKIGVFLGLYIFVIVAGGSLVALLCEQLTAGEAFYAAFSCVSNAGVDAHLSLEGSIFSVVPDSARWVLSLLMLTGRLEIFTVLLLLMPQFWKR